MRAHVSARAALVVLLLWAPRLALAGEEGDEDTCRRPALQLLRAEEDHSSLRAAACRTELLDPLKYIPLWPESVYFTLGGDVRERYELVRNPSWGRGKQDPSGYLLQRYSGHASLHLGPYFRAFVQLRSALATGKAAGPGPVDEDTLDVQALFLELNSSSGPAFAVMARVGRQEVSYGSSRLISVRDGPNVRRSFDGVRVVASLAGWQADAFLLSPVATSRGAFDDWHDPGETLWGVYVAGELIPGVVGLDLYQLSLARRDSSFSGITDDELRHSLGLRVWGEVSSWDYDVEGVYQVGTFGSSEIRSWSLASDVGFRLTRLPGRPRLGLRANVTSGDVAPSDHVLQTFNPLYPRGTYYGEAALMGPQNHVDLHPAVELRLPANLRVSMDWDFFWRTSLADGVYAASGALQVPGDRSKARYVGSQVSWDVAWLPVPQATFHLSLAHFFAGPFLRESGPGRDVDFFAAWLSLHW
ncbi:MAG: alginate export family protein [Myxococcota bacterium]